MAEYDGIIIGAGHNGLILQAYLGIEKPFAVESAFTAKLLDPAIKMDAGKVPK